MQHISMIKLDSFPIMRPGWPWTPQPDELPPTLSDGTPWPKISVVTPSYNQAAYLEEAIRSTLLQGYPNLELVIIDGGSSDDTLGVLQKYSPWIAQWVSEPDRGQSHAINKGIRRANGDILLWLNADDLVLPGAFRRAAEAFHDHPGIKLVVGQAKVIDEQSRVTGELRSRFTSWEEMLTTPSNVLRQVSTFFARELFDALGGVDENLHIAMDTELLLRFARVHPPLVLDTFLTAYREQPEAKSYRQIVRGYEESDRVRRAMFPNVAVASRYRQRSAENWLYVSTFPRLHARQRLACLRHALQNRPALLLRRAFWSRLWKALLPAGRA